MEETNLKRDLTGLCELQIHFSWRAK